MTPARKPTPRERAAARLEERALIGEVQAILRTLRESNVDPTRPGYRLAGPFERPLTTEPAKDADGWELDEGRP